jgi:hypothetical protein
VERPKSGEFKAGFQVGLTIVLTSRVNPPSFDTPGAGPHRLKLLDANGRTLYELADPAVDALFESVRSCALDADKAIDGILAELKGRQESESTPHG